MGERIGREVTVHGYVQGVFFRDTCRQVAERAGVAGWVSNEADGTVRVQLVGPPEAVEQVVRWCSDGPDGARVERVEVDELDPVPETEGFGVR